MMPPDAGSRLQSPTKRPPAVLPGASDLVAGAVSECMTEFSKTEGHR
jgi:hypothetical protein